MGFNSAFKGLMSKRSLYTQIFTAFLNVLGLSMYVLMSRCCNGDKKKTHSGEDPQCPLLMAMKHLYGTIWCVWGGEGRGGKACSVLAQSKRRYIVSGQPYRSARTAPLLLCLSTFSSSPSYIYCYPLRFTIPGLLYLILFLLLLF